MKKPLSERASVASKKRAAVKKPATKTTATASTRPAKNILSAGIRALSNAHGEAVARQSRVFESLLGIAGRSDDRPATTPTGEAAAQALTAPLDPFGFRKFEDVFDQRVARALDNLGVPTMATVTALQADVDRLQARVATLEAAARKR